MSAAEQALTHVTAGSIVGLGTGRAATEFVRALGARVQQGFHVRGVPTSETTAKLARELGIPLLTLDEAGSIDVTVDGADEVDPDLNLIKGYGGALLREKIVAAASRRLIILVGPEKRVPVLGTRGRLPVEVVPFAPGVIAQRLAQRGCPATPRQAGGKPFISDNGNIVLDCTVGPIVDPAELDRVLRDIPGVISTGLFVGMADLVLIQEPNGVTELKRP